MGVSVAVRGLRLTAAGLGVAALVTALVQSTGSVANFFSYFTVESNILAVVALAGGAVLTGCPRGWPYFRGAVTLYMAITGIVYALLLSDVDVQLSAQWVNATLHEILPLFLLVDWILFPPWPRASYRKALGWLAFPLVFVAYSLIRGPIVDWYPYPFLDPRPHGYLHVVWMSVLIGLGMVVLALAVLWIGRQRLAAQSRSPAASTMSKQT
ncbi:MAG TPA: Pr6Pr family membrane protein [Mycobacteriales bacterium]|jgi:hypothetical protein